MLWRSNRAAVDESVAERIAQITWPTHSQPFSPQESVEWGGDHVAEVLSAQFSFVATTQVMVLVQFHGTPIALVGFAGDVRPTYGRMVLLEVVTALENLAEAEYLRQEAVMYRDLLNRHEEALIVATERGQIKGATPSGWKALSRAQNGERGTVVKQSEQQIPNEIAVAVYAGEPPTLNGVTIAGTRVGGAELVEDLVLYRFQQTDSTELSSFDEAAKRLTPAQSQVLRLLLRGLHYKEIALRLGNSAHTVHHHVSAILERLDCSDKLELLAKFQVRTERSQPRKKSFPVPPLTQAPVVEDYPQPVKRRSATQRKAGT
jgi:DNA-binding CsgD family transcriptional regulator